MSRWLFFRNLRKSEKNDNHWLIIINIPKIILLVVIVDLLESPRIAIKDLSSCVTRLRPS